MPTLHRPAGLLASLFGLLLLATSAAAENSTRIDGYAIHHNALTTDMLNPQVASSYGILRSHNRALVNISIIREQPGTPGTPVAGVVTLTARNLVGQIRELPLREIREDGAIYYLAEFPVANQERLLFSVSARVAGTAQPLRARFEQTFFTR